MRTAILALAMFFVSTATCAAGGIGFERAAVPDSDGTPREIGIWYPSDALASPQPLGPHRQTVAVGGSVAGRQLPLVVILHGVQGTFDNHSHTALALAEAGFAVTGVTHTQEIKLIERPRHARSVVDYMLGAWSGRDRLDPGRVGVYGFSVGGFTTLVTIGGVPELARVPDYCARYPDSVCAALKERSLDMSTPASAWTHDSRIKAVVIAAPTLGFTFSADALAPIKAPIQLWRAGNDEITPHPRHAEAVYQALATKPEYHVVPDAGHFVFIACSAEMTKRAPAICGDAPAFDRTAFHQKFNGAVVGFFRSQLLVR